MSIVSKAQDLLKHQINPEDYRVAAFIVNYNMPERADALYEKLSQNTKWPLDIYLIGNGSDLKPPAKHTTLLIKKNVQTCRGWLKGLNEAKKSGHRYFAYMFLITSTEIPGEQDVVTPMVKFLIKSKNAVGIHPSLTLESTTNWEHLKTRKTGRIRQTWMIDNIASMYRATWFDKVGRFDPELIYAWGIDLETCYLARKEGKTIWVDDSIQVTKITNIAYKMNRMKMTAEERSKRAFQNMDRVLSKRYGKGYWDMINKDYITKQML